MSHFLILKRLLGALASLTLGLSASAAAAEPCCRTQNVITVIIDGARWEEVFRGVDPRFFEPAAGAYYRLPAGAEAFKRTFWRETPEARRETLMPFLWGTVAAQGQLYGDRDKGSEVRLRNGFHISYPGHSEFLTGIADDERIVSNEFKPNPNKTILEVLEAKPAFKGRTAVFSTWDAYPDIMNVGRSGLMVHSPPTPTPVSDPGGRMDVLKALLTDTGPSMHSDAITFHLALEYLKLKRPRVMHISLQNADRPAHSGYYDDYVQAIRSSDAYIRQIWEWVQSDPDYRDKTTLIVATDHGRGAGSLELFKTHGTPGYRRVAPGEVNPTEGDQYSWIAILGPDTPARGEMSNTPPVELAQVAATVMALLKEPYVGDHPTLRPAPPISTASPPNP